MTPQDDARVLLALVDRYLRALRINHDAVYPELSMPGILNREQGRAISLRLAGILDS